MIAHNQAPLPFEYNYDFKRNSFEWRLPKHFSRILLYVNKNREGCNNKYARIFVLARTLTSRKTLVQSVGRYIRGVRCVESTGLVHVPPKQLDQPLIISHDAFQNEAALLWSWQYLRDPLSPVSFAEDFPTLENLVAGLEPNYEQEQDIIEPIAITNTSKMDIAEAVGRLQMFETTGDLTHLTTSNGGFDSRFKQTSDSTWRVDTNHWVESDSGEKLEQVQELVQKIQISPVETAKALFGSEIASEATLEIADLKVLPVLKHELFDFYNAPLEIIEDTMKSLEPIFYQAIQHIPDSNIAQDLLRKQYAQIMDRNHIRQETSKHLDIEKIRSSIESSVKQDFRFLRDRLGANSPEWREFCGDIIRTTRRTVHSLFGLASFEVGSEFDTPEYHWKLIKYKSRVKGQVRRSLIYTSHHLSYLRNVISN